MRTLTLAIGDSRFAKRRWYRGTARSDYYHRDSPFHLVKL